MDNEALESIFYRYREMVYKTAFLYLKNETDALDVVQNTFLKLSKQKKFNDEEHLKRWLLRVSINLCKNNLKSYWKRNVTSFNEEYYCNENVDIQLKELVFKLAPKYKGVIYLYYYQGYKIKEIAKILHIKEAAVKQRLKRGREKLKIEWEVIK